VTINWSNVIRETDEGTKVIPPGEYNVRVTEAQAVKASSGSDMIKTTVKLEDPPYAGRSLITNLVFTFDNPIAMRMLFRRLSALGVTAEWLAESSASVPQIAEAIKGRSSLAKINVRRWNNEDRNDVEMFLDGSGAGVPGVAAPGLGPDVAPPPPSLEGIDSPAPAVNAHPPSASAPGTGPAPF
jgi:Protein of unknown function (DUF669)